MSRDLKPQKDKENNIFTGKEKNNPEFEFSIIFLSRINETFNKL